ncbi:carboxypeptidase B-like [Watersipora subatra]|uniref:carboxypeptidase B-like n=1 Tax=Watersipora subatra TaxID=2589382 RepID=UPI00355B3197
MNLGYLLIVLTLTQLTRAERSLRLTTIDTSKMDMVKPSRIVSMVNKLDNPKAEASWRKETTSVMIITEDELLRHEIVERVVNDLKVAEDNIRVEVLPEVKVKNSFRLQKRSEKMFDLNFFNTLESINDYLEELAHSNPDLVFTKTIGYSYENRPIKVLIISLNDGVIKPKIFFDGGQHAREWISPAVLLSMAQKLIKGYREDDHKLKKLVERYEFHILPVLNPDGYVFTYKDDGIRLWRKNRRNTTNSYCAGVDLNRNWDFHWSGRGGSTDRCSIVYQGEAPFSEGETLSAANYILERKGEWHSYFSFHSFGQMILFPYSHTQLLGPDYVKHMTAGRKLSESVKSVNGRNYAVGPVGMLLYEASGSSESWAYSVGVPYTYTVELPDRKTFVVPPEIIEPTAKEWVEGLAAYIEFIEMSDAELYGELVANITILNPTTTSEPRIQAAFDDSHAASLIPSLHLLISYFIAVILFS